MGKIGRKDRRRKTNRVEGKRGGEGREGGREGKRERRKKYGGIRGTSESIGFVGTEERRRKKVDNKRGKGIGWTKGYRGEERKTGGSGKREAITERRKGKRDERR